MSHWARVKSVLSQEADAIRALCNRDGDPYTEAVDQILSCRGRIVCCGLGKSGHIAAKAAATFSSTGTPAFFLHAAEALHGDLGMVTENDIVVFYTYSGESDEIMRVAPAVKQIGAKTVLLTGRVNSSAAQMVDTVLDVGVESEACPNNLAPTTSTTVMLALSDALAVAAMGARGFSPEDFARFHPAGALGRRLTLRVSDVMRTGSDVPLSKRDDDLLDVMLEISRAGAGCSCVVSVEGAVEGLITEGDLRRHIVLNQGSLVGTAESAMTVDPTYIEPDLLAIEAFEVFQNHPSKIGEMPVVSDGKLVGLLMLKDVSRCGIV